jgi:hypothetical protein
MALLTLRRVPLTLLLIVLTAVSVHIGSTHEALAGPTLLKRTVTVTAYRMASYWRDRNADSPEWNTWSWLPRIEFQIVGPVEGGSQFSVDYTMPDGKPWFTQDLYTEELPDGYWGQVKTEFKRDKAEEVLGTLSTGVFGFTVRITNELTGTREVLMTGRFKVNKIHVGIKERPNENEYYVDQDWRLPLGTVWFNTEDNSQSPPLYMGLWVRGNAWRPSELAGYLFHNGKQIGSTKSDTWSHIGITADLLTMGNRDEDPAWKHIGLDFMGVLGMRGEDMAGRTDLFFVNENPGEYELKILSTGKLVRSMKFTVGADGRIVDSGIGTEQRPSGTRYLIPVKIVGGPDGTWDQNAWKTDAYYGNPYAGFTALPVGAN